MFFICMMLAIINQAELQTDPTANGCWRVYSVYHEVDGEKSSGKCLNQYVIVTDSSFIDCNLEFGKTRVTSFDLLRRTDELSSTHMKLSAPSTAGPPIGDEVEVYFDSRKSHVCRFRFDSQDVNGFPKVVVYFAERITKTNDALSSLHDELQAVFDNPHDFKRLEKCVPTNSNAPSNGYWNVEAVRIRNRSESTDWSDQKCVIMLSDGHFCSSVYQRDQWVVGYEHTIQAQISSGGTGRCILDVPFQRGKLQRKMTVRYDARVDRTEIEFKGVEPSVSVTLLLRRLSDDERDSVIEGMRWRPASFVAAKRPQQ